ncbi:hypothetical protein Dimus_020045 [Dionaea muscipula]
MMPISSKSRSWLLNRQRGCLHLATRHGCGFHGLPAMDQLAVHEEGCQHGGLLAWSRGWTLVADQAAGHVASREVGLLTAKLVAWTSTGGNAGSRLRVV